MDTALTRRLEAAMKESGFCLASYNRSEHAISITTPFIMPDGDVMNFYAKPNADGGWAITDFGDTAGLCLFNRGHVGDVPASHIVDVQEVLEAYESWHSVKFEDGTLSLETTDERLPDALRHFTQILLYVAHICSFGASTELDTGDRPDPQQGIAAN